MDCHCLRRVLLICTLTSALMGCRGDSEEGEEISLTSLGASRGAALLSIAPEAPGQNCASGGSRIDRGVDTNGNDVLDVTEITDTQFVCNSGGPGNSLVETHDEPAGANCPNGGVKISSGADGNRNGALDIEEISSTQFVCGGVSATATLIRTDSEAPGLNCTYGGTRISAGLDANGSATLEPGEVTATAYACNGAPGPGVVWQDVTDAAVQATGNSGYLANNDTAEVIVTLPSAPVLGELVQVSGIGAGGWRIAQNPGQFIVTRHLAGEIATAWVARESMRSWQSVASSADGLRLIAADYGGQLHTSSDGGVSWTARESSRAWRAVASSANGQRLVAAETGGPLYVSEDAGVSWLARESGRDWSSIASSADGMRLVAAVTDGQLYTSTDAGLNWAARSTDRAWVAVASSADGQRLVAAVSGGRLYTSVNAGVGWTSRESNRDWTSVASSADGRRLVASVFLGQLHTSEDAGINWTPRDVSRGWFALASSADGQRLLAAEIGGQLYSSSDAGASWTARELQRSWSAVVSSADGTKLAAAVINDQIFTSVPRPRESTTVGIAGSVAGRQFDAITLQYAGADKFVVLNFTGTPIVE